HPCDVNHECSTQCRKCQKSVQRKLLNCGHEIEMKCFVSVENFKCREKCGKSLPCGHSCVQKCSEACGPCQETTMKQQVKCNEEALPENCKTEIVISETACTHAISVNCNKRNASRQEIQSFCSKPCDFMFPTDDNGCGHKCSGTCGACLMGTLHEKCKDKCQRALICGHICNFPCSKNCPPCVKKCQMKCKHSKCKMQCGDDCFICKCKHKRCTKLCGEMCDRGPCHEPCENTLKCGHMCIGFCGEVCPPLCRVCNMDKLTELQLLFTEDDEDARFIWLPDCRHAIEVEGLTMHFNASDEKGEIGLKRCPRCTTVVTTLSGRFGNIIRKTFQDVAAVKRTYFGNREQNKRISEDIQDKLLVEENNLRNHLPLVKSFFEKMLYFERNIEDSDLQLRVIDIHTLQSLQQIWIWGSRANIEAKTLYDDRILASLTCNTKYDERSQQIVLKDIKKLEEYLKTGLGISEGERTEIIKAFNMKGGHWFKCPNGHFYMIGECGGAMQIATCNECGATIGGNNHSLLADNQFGGEMDGAARPAWDTVMIPQNYGF
ncbi:NFX1-type zinc finger-containing protein 1, partial [Pseudolycoriella hygida]